MNFSWRYTVTFLSISFAILSIIIVSSSGEHVFGRVVIFLWLCLILYPLTPFLIDRYLREKEMGQYNKKRSTEESRRKFARAQHLKEKYRRMKVKELVVDSTILRSDKLLIL